MEHRFREEIEKQLKQVVDEAKAEVEAANAQPETSSDTTAVDTVEENEIIEPPSPALKAHRDWRNKWYIRHNDLLTFGMFGSGLAIGVSTFALRVMETQIMQSDQNALIGFGSAVAVMTATYAQLIGVAIKDHKLFERIVSEQSLPISAQEPNSQQDVTILPLPSSGPTLSAEQQSQLPVVEQSPGITPSNTQELSVPEYSGEQQRARILDILDSRIAEEEQLLAYTKEQITINDRTRIYDQAQSWDILQAQKTDRSRRLEAIKKQAERRLKNLQKQKQNIEKAK